MSIFDLKTGESAYITRINVTGGAATRLTSLGFTAGKKITVLAFSLFKSSVLVGCGAVRLSMRKSFALEIEVAKCA